MPSANPRSWRVNQPMIARPLAPVALAPKAPTTSRPSRSTTNPSVNAIAKSATAVASRPPASTGRSPTRSVSIPHGTVVTVTPTDSAATASPICPSESPKTLRSSGPSAGKPIRSPVNAAAPNAPTARTTQR